MIQGKLYRLDGTFAPSWIGNKKKHNVKQAHFVRLTILNKLIKVKNEISDTLKCILTWIVGSVIFPYQYDNHVHHVSTFISVSSPVPALWHFPLTGCFFQHSGLSFLRHTNPGNAFQLVFKVRLNTPLNSTVQGSN